MANEKRVAIIIQYVTQDNMTPAENADEYAKAAKWLESNGYEIVVDKSRTIGKRWTNEEMAKRYVKKTEMGVILTTFERMALCDTIYLCPSTKGAEICDIITSIAKFYNFEIIYGK